MKKGLLLINLGTPEHPDIFSVGRYLSEFLADKRVIDLPAPLRYLLLYGFILPFRLKASTAAYRSIWTAKGSPLLYHSQRLVKKVQQKAGNECKVVLGMRYGRPSIDEALQSLKSCEHITILPLYPQYSSAATGSSIEYCLHLMKTQTIFPSLKIIRDFYQHPAFIKAQAELIAPFFTKQDHLLFSYHGLPERQLLKKACPVLCQRECRPMMLDNQACYRAQCYQTSRLLAQQLNLTETQFSTSFQSRLGKTPWIKPYTDEMLPLLISKGIKRLVVACPSFMADCLETLEEIGIRAREQWLAAGGEELKLVTCLNDNASWAEAILKITRIHS
ncbi:ferrochelatase [Legionella israelensis]|uniref:Ferrochelatase n=1 Tax=Legionella israelensis TaxID=454 RepID=A0A0W0VNY1_9GAMM|nr:ferrochelatase [Legionella israelensis]KTD21478.1 ferrochelatase [Legionella israelensis]QBS10046.1 ferrochelatase [Legionella israelensis]SCX78740.1 ferrochelatase [Legionella israelensis DSM 19235]STX59630.1 ferrochelatase [Legionella israelensis]